jgi:hypothetical protein
MSGEKLPHCGGVIPILPFAGNKYGKIGKIGVL